MHIFAADSEYLKYYNKITKENQKNKKKLKLCKKKFIKLNTYIDSVI